MQEQKDKQKRKKLHIKTKKNKAFFVGTIRSFLEQSRLLAPLLLREQDDPIVPGRQPMPPGIALAGRRADGTGPVGWTAGDRAGVGLGGRGVVTSAPLKATWVHKKESWHSLRSCKSMEMDMENFSIIIESSCL
jgi:hypothetical protein